MSERGRIKWETGEGDAWLIKHPPPSPSSMHNLGTEKRCRHFSVGWLYPSHTHFQFAFAVFCFNNALEEIKLSQQFEQFHFVRSNGMKTLTTWGVTTNSQTGVSEQKFLACALIISRCTVVGPTTVVLGHLSHPGDLLLWVGIRVSSRPLSVVRLHLLLNNYCVTQIFLGNYLIITFCRKTNTPDYE